MADVSPGTYRFFPEKDFQAPHVINEDFLRKIENDLIGLQIQIYSSCFSAERKSYRVKLSPLGTILITIRVHLQGGVYDLKIDYPALSATHLAFNPFISGFISIDGEKSLSKRITLLKKLEENCKMDPSEVGCKTILTGRVQSNALIEKRFSTFNVGVDTTLKNVSSSGLGRVVTIFIPKESISNTIKGVNAPVISKVVAEQVAVPYGNVAFQNGVVPVLFDQALSKDHQSVKLNLNYPGIDSYCRDVL